MTSPASPFRLAAINPGGNDAEQSFPDFAGEVSERAHAPINHHGYAAATGGSFHRKAGTIPEKQRDVLLLIRWDLALSLKTLRKLKTASRRVAVTLKESGSSQIAELIVTARKFRIFEEICQAADGCIAGTPDLVPFYRAAGAKEVEFIPTPYPVEDSRWDFAIPFAGRRGIFVGTREFEIPSRNHLAAMLAAREISRRLDEPVTVINPEGGPGRQLLREMNFPRERLRVVEGPVPYPHYVRLMAEHRVVFQLDNSSVPGQVAGDALLCRMPCIGGNGAIEKLIFPATSSHGRTVPELIALVEDLVRDEAAHGRIVAEAKQRALEEVSFGVIARRLNAFFEKLGDAARCL